MDKKIIIFYEKHKTFYYNSSTITSKIGALKHKFDERQDQVGFYDSKLMNNPGELEAYQEVLDGNLAYLESFMSLRSEYEYENWEEHDVQQEFLNWKRVNRKDYPN